MSLSHLTEASFASSIASGTTLVDFWADWCGPCKMLAPVIEELAEELDGRIAVAKVDTDAEGALAIKYGITGIPTVILFKNGAEIARFVGAHPKEMYIAALGE
jgi:thioredoxin 1